MAAHEQTPRRYRLMLTLCCFGALLVLGVMARSWPASEGRRADVPGDVAPSSPRASRSAHAAPPAIDRADAGSTTAEPSRARHSRPSVPERAPEPSTQVEGRVIDATGGVIAGAHVEASSELQRASAETDAEGRFALAVEGRVTLLASAEGYSRAMARVEAPATEVTLVLVPSASVSGRVLTDGGDEPVPGARVTAINLDGVLEPPPSVEAGADGSFVLPALASGRYTLEAEAAGFQPARTAVPVALADAVSGIELRLSRAGALHAQVSAGGAPCTSAHVVLDGVVTAHASGDETGTVHIAGLTPGTYRASVHCASALAVEDTLSVSAGAPTRREWDLDPGLSISGSVARASGEPLPAARIAVFPARAVLGESEGSPPPSAATYCESDDVGAFSCAGVMPGEYDVGLDDDQHERSPKVRVAVGPSSAGGLAIVAHAAATLRIGASEPERNGELDSVSVTEPSSGRVYLALREGGLHVVRDLPLGEYRITSASTRGEASATLARDGETVDVALTLASRTSISGVVVDHDGEPLPDVWVRAEPAEPSGGAPAAGQRALTDAQGAFTLVGSFGGPQRLVASSGSARGELASVTPGATSVVLRANALGALAGTVQTRRGEPVKSFSLTYVNEAGEGETIIGKGGRWSVDGLARGSYSLRVVSEAGSATGSATVAGDGAADVTLIVQPGADETAALDDRR